MIGLMQKTVLW